MADTTLDDQNSQDTDDPTDLDSLTTDQQNSLNEALAGANLAEHLEDDEKLSKIGSDVVTGYQNDELSRTDWMMRNRDYMKLATQVMEKKSFPWEGAANVKYPMLTTAALQFAARAYSALVPSLDVVKCKVVGDDPQGQLTDLANKLSTHMSYKVMYEIEDWEENMDKLTFILPIVGTMFKKIYYNDADKEICSELLSPKDIVVNYYTRNIRDATRITEIQYYTVNEIKSFQTRGDWLDGEDYEFQPGRGVLKETVSEDKTTGMVAPTPDDETPRAFLVQYCWLDLDDDDYKEPYIVTVDLETKKVVRIVANFYAEGIEFKDASKKEIVAITPAEWFVKFDFLPNPDGGFYGIGFGILLGGLNEMVNTITNQLIDSGTLANLQAGFIGRGLRDNKQKKLGFRPGEWMWVNNPGKDLKENIFPLPVREPSATLYQLLGTLVQSGKEMASVAEIFTGKMPGQNTPASTTMATIEQGLKVFTSIYKRIYRSMGKEFCLIFELLKRYMPAQPVTVVGQLNGQDTRYSVSKFDYSKAKEVHIVPAADPNMVSETQKLLRIQGLYELVQLGTINKGEMTRQALVYQGQDNITELLKVPPAPPPMELQVEQLKLQSKEKLETANLQLQAQKVQQDAMRLQADLMVLKSQAILNLAKARQADAQDQIMTLEIELERISAAQDMAQQHAQMLMDVRKQAVQQAMDAKSSAQDQAQAAQEHQFEMIRNNQMHQQEMAQMEDLHSKQMDLMDAKTQALKAQQQAKGNFDAGS